MTISRYETNCNNRKESSRLISSTHRDRENTINKERVAKRLASHPLHLPPPIESRRENDNKNKKHQRAIRHNIYTRIITRIYAYSSPSNIYTSLSLEARSRQVLEKYETRWVLMIVTLIIMRCDKIAITCVHFILFMSNRDGIS